MTRGISGPSSRDSFAYYDPESSSLRTSQGTFDLDSTPSSLTLPAWGSMSGGELFELRTPEPPTDAPDYSFLRTPTVGMLNADRAKDPAYFQRMIDRGHTRTLAHEERRNRTGVDSMGRPNQGRTPLLPTPIPRPTDARGRLMPEFVEWMMGLPIGWTDGVSRTHRLRMLGNAVCPQQGALALRLLEAA